MRKAEFQQDDSAQRAKLVLLSDTTLQDLPSELLECILINVVVMEVKALKLAKCAWKEKADLVIARLGTVCSQWSSTLATNFFRNELYRTLDGTAQGTIRLAVLRQSQLQYFGPMRLQCTTMNDEIFLLCTSPDHQVNFINVYDRNDDMAKVTHVIPLPGLLPEAIAGCSVSNCVYILNRKLYDHYSILCLARDGGHWSTVGPSTVISDLCLPKSTLSVSANGRIILSRQQSWQRDAISVYDANGALQQEMRVPSDVYWIEKIIPKSNGNLLYVSLSINGNGNLTEINMAGDIIHQYRSAVNSLGFRFSAPSDNYGRVVFFSDQDYGIKLIDSEFNFLDLTRSQFDGVDLSPRFSFHYSNERNELVSVVLDHTTSKGILTIFQLREF